MMDVQSIKNIVHIGDIIAPDGACGAVRFKPFINSFSELKHQGVFLGSDGRFYRLTSEKACGAYYRFSFDCVNERKEAEAITGMKLYAHNDALPKAKDGDVYYRDLIGLPVVDEHGVEHGSVVDVQNFGAGDLIEIKGPHGLAYIPFTHEHVPTINLETGRVVICDYEAFFDCALALNDLEEENPE